MPLTAEEKNLIASGTALTAQVVISQTASLAAGPQALVFLPFLPGLIGLQLYLNRVRFPRISTADIGRLAVLGPEFTTSRDPFFGDVVVSRPEQARFLEALVEASAIRRVVAEADNTPILLARRAVIEGLAETAEERGFASVVDPTLRGGVFRPTADAPLQFIEGDFLA